jgi:hypothetical protein
MPRQGRQGFVGSREKKFRRGDRMGAIPRQGIPYCYPYECLSCNAVRGGNESRSKCLFTIC